MKKLVVKITTHLYLAPTLRMGGTVPPVTHMPSWREEGEFYLLLVQTSFPV